MGRFKADRSPLRLVCLSGVVARQDRLRVFPVVDELEFPFLFLESEDFFSELIEIF